MIDYINSSYCYVGNSGFTHRLPLAPIKELSRLKKILARIQQIVLTEQRDFDDLWKKIYFRNACLEAMRLNGVVIEDINLKQAFEFCVNYSKPPLLAVYNCLTAKDQPINSQGVKDFLENSAGAEYRKPTVKRKQAKDYLPIIGTDNEPQYASGIPILKFEEFACIYSKILKEIAEISESYIFPNFPSYLIYSNEVRFLAIRFIELFGLNPNLLNIHQVSSLAVNFAEEPPLLAQLGGLVPDDIDDTDDLEDETPRERKPKVDIESLPWYTVGQLVKGGVSVSDAIELISNATTHQMESFMSGLDGNKTQDSINKLNPMLSEMTPSQRLKAMKKAGSIYRHRTEDLYSMF